MVWYCPIVQSGHNYDVLMKINIYKALKVIVIVTVVIIVYLIGNAIYKKSILGHSADWTTYKKYTWIFQDSVKDHLSKTGSSFISQFDAINSFRYNGELFVNNLGQDILVCEFFDSQIKSVSSLKIKENQDLDNVKFEEYETLDPETDAAIYIKYGYSLANGITVNIDETDTVLYHYRGDNYIGCFGKIEEFALSDNNGEYQMLLTNYRKNTNAAIILYKKKDQTFLIFITSDEKIDRDIIDILRLE